MPRKPEYKPLLYTTTIRNPERFKDFMHILKRFNGRILQSPNQKIPDRKTKCVIKTHINIKQNVIFGAKLKPV